MNPAIKRIEAARSGADLRAEWDRLSLEAHQAWEAMMAARGQVGQAQARLAAARQKHAALQARLATIGGQLWPELRQP